jgi:hypothetical protein
MTTSDRGRRFAISLRHRSLPHALARRIALSAAFAIGMFSATLAPEASAAHPASPPPAAPAPAQIGEATFDVTFPEGTTFAGRPNAGGRLVIALIGPGSTLPPTTSLLDAPFWDEQQPMFAMDLPAAAAGSRATLTATTPGVDASMMRADALPAGTYRAQARFIWNRCSSNWKQCEGNLYSRDITFTIKPGQTTGVALPLSETTKARAWKDVPGRVELVEIRSELLSTFHKREVMLRAGVVLPVNFDPARSYAAVYEIPGFGGDHFVARRMGQSKPTGAREALLRQAFWIVLDPESPNGHTLFADSDNNGPAGEALIRELIPAIEKRYPLTPKPEARLLRGHSSGGWASLWLCLTYPTTFGAAWSTSPDPVDFRAFQLVDIYTMKNMYAPGEGRPDFVSYRRAGQDVMTVRQENAGERMIGPNQTSGMQWASWQAVAGARSPDGHPVALFDSVTGAIDAMQLDRWKRYDITDRIRKSPENLIPILTERVRLVCGTTDNFFLEGAVKLLKADAERLTTELVASGKLDATTSPVGYIKLIEGKDHGTILRTPEVRAFDAQMLNHLNAHGLVK